MPTPAGDLAETVIELPERLDYAACESVVRTLEQNRGRGLQLRAGSVGFLGGLAAEILLRARAEWHADGLRFDVTEASSDLLQGLSLLGIPHANLIAEGNL